MESQDVRTAVVGVLRPTLPALTDEVLSSVVEAVPPFDEWWGGRLDLRGGVQQGLAGSSSCSRPCWARWPWRPRPRASA